MDGLDADAHMNRMGHAVRHIEMQDVRSSSIAAVGYDLRRQTLRIRFVGGDAYDYLHVAHEVFRQLLDAPSKGRFINYEVKPRFPYRRVSRAAL
jgi:hypothetical protein